MDERGFLRVGGRLQHAPGLSFNAKHPLLIPRDHLFTRRYFQYIHQKTMHSGPRMTLSTAQLKYWAPRGKVLANITVSRCVVCRKARPRAYQQVMADLPPPRVEPVERAFLTVGVDFAGPITIHHPGRGSRPTTVYLAVFVCFATKAVHLEIVSDLTTAAFINTLRRFVGRRGKPTTIWSDNATNFVGAARELKKLTGDPNFWPVIFNWCCNDEGIQWRFIPPRSPHFGGLWEAAVKSTKHHLLRVAGTAPLHRDELDTLLATIESILNSRPIIPVVMNPSDDQPLTPAHFIIGQPFTALPERDMSQLDANHLQRYQRIVALHTQNYLGVGC